MTTIKSKETIAREKRNKHVYKALDEQGPPLSTPGGGVPKSTPAQKMRAKLYGISRRESTPTATKTKINKLRDFLTIYKPKDRQYKDAMAAANKIVDSASRKGSGRRAPKTASK